MSVFKRLFLICATFTLLLGIAGSAFAQAPLVNVSATAQVTTGACSGSGGACQQSGCNNGAGPNPQTISATVSLCQVNGVLRVVGVGNGFTFGKGKVYVSLLYKNGNTATCSRFPNGVAATRDNATNPASGVDNDFASMMLGVWQVLPDGSAKLIVSKEAPVPGLQNYGTVSVREVQLTQVANACYRPDLDPAPQLNALRACGGLVLGPPCAANDVCTSLCAVDPRICDTVRRDLELGGLCEPIL